MTLEERDEYDLFLQCLKASKQIVDYDLNEDGTQLIIQPVIPTEFVYVDFMVKDKDVEEFEKNYLINERESNEV